MKVTSSWIQKWLRRTMFDAGKADSTIVSALERAGMEVEQVIASPRIDKHVVVGLTKKVIQHPQADRLKLVEVNVGEKDLRIVCGAKNVREGLKVAVAQIGTTLPDGDRIEPVKLRGEVSEGMLCSALELKLGEDHDGILELSSDVAVGTPLCDIYPADALIDLKTPANRFDVLSVVGLAREVAAMTGSELAPLSPPAVPIAKDGPEVTAGALASRYMLARVKVDQSAPSPREMTARLQAAGMRPVGPVVDITNFALLELGQPMHAFDAAKVKLPLAVRQAKAGEKLTTLDGAERKLTTADLVIADQSGPIALAGLMGGAATEVSPKTKEILLEVAVFAGTAVRKMAKRHSLRTEASARFERGLPVELSPLAMNYALDLLQKHAGGQTPRVTDQLNVKPSPLRVTLSIAKLSKLLGFGITHKETIEALGRLQIAAKKIDDDTVEVSQVPWWRTDIKLAEDLVEEVVRVIGYDKVPSTIPSWRPQRVAFDRVRSVRRRVRDLMYAAGLFEVMTYSFVSEDQLAELGHQPGKHLKLKNPLSSEQAYLRSTLLPSHLAVLGKNRTYAKELGFYEISGVFVKQGPGEQPAEPLRLAVTVARTEAAYAVAKGILDALARELGVELAVKPQDDKLFAPGRAGVVELSGKGIGWIGQLHPERVRKLKLDDEAAYFEVDLAPLIAASEVRQFGGVSRYPTIQRDLAVLLPVEVTWRDVSEALASQRVEFVSDYYGAELPEGYKVLAIRLTLTNPDRTPTESEAEGLEKSVMATLKSRLGAKPR